MQDTAFGRALNPVELSNSRYLDALSAFRPNTCLAMTAGAAEGGAAGGDGGDAAAQAAAAAATAAAAAAAKAETSKNALDEQGNDLGYPKDTPVAQMTDGQSAAYHRHQSQKHEGRYKNLVGTRSFDDTKKALEEYDRIQKEQQTPAEQALTAAREEGQKAGLTAARTETASTVFRGALEVGGLPPADIDELVANFNVAGYITDAGVETAKINAFAKRFTTPGTGTTRPPRDFGAGTRTGGAETRGAAGKAEATKRFGTKTA